MARSVKELQAWAELLELCADDCAVFSTTKAMRSAILEVELELSRLHRIEDLAIQMARLFKRLRCADGDDWDVCIDGLWEREQEICEAIEALVPEAFTPEAMADVEAGK